MVRDKELEKLQLEIAKEKDSLARQVKIAKSQQEKKRLKRELLFLKNPKKVALGRSFGRGFKILGKKVGKTLIKQAQLIKEQQLREAAASKKIVRTKIKKVKRTTKSRPKLIKGSESSFFAPLDF